jgi:hypothetical protein
MPRPCHTQNMAHPVFRLIPESDDTFSVSLKTPDGRLKTIPGFGSEHEARAWIVQTQRLLGTVGGEYRPGPNHEGSREFTPGAKHQDNR